MGFWGKVFEKEALLVIDILGSLPDHRKGTHENSCLGSNPGIAILCATYYATLVLRCN